MAANGLFSGKRPLPTLVILTALLLTTAAPATSAQEPHIPAPLESWVGWALWGQPDPNCPQVSPDGSRQCVWPGSLSVNADQQGATFTLDVWLAAPALVPLPGDATRWPQSLRANGRPVAIQTEAGKPALKLPRGAHRITGEFAWSKLPEMLPVPKETGRITLTVADNPIPRPNLDDQGRLWLSATTDDPDTDSEGTLRVSIYRRFNDDIPLKVATELSLNVSGKARKVDLGQVLLAESRPVQIHSALPVQLDPTGNISAYVRPGTHRVRIDAVFQEDTTEISAPSPAPDIYDPQEVWVWIPSEAIRSVELSGLQGVDPARTTLPRDWYGHSTYLARAGDTLHLEVTRQGIEPAPNTINLHRQLWLDIDGQGMSIRDAFQGSMNQTWRLNYGGDATLGYVQQANDESGLLITLDPETGRRGVELRRTALDLTAHLRLEKMTTTLPAVGWDQDVQKLSADLYLPPGWTLFGASGVDIVSGSWLSSWTLWHFFFVLIIAMSIGKLLGWQWAPLAAAALVLSHGYQGAPMWSWIHLIAAQALLGVLPPGWWRRLALLWRGVTLLVLFISLASFATKQIKSALYPQLDRSAFSQGAHSYGFDPFSGVSLPTAPIVQRVPSKFEVASSLDSIEFEGLELDSASRQRYARKASDALDLKGIDPQAVVQTGQGLPTWDWNRWELNWSGPVHQDHKIRLWLIAPWLNKSLALLRVLALIALALLLLLSPAARTQRRSKKNVKKPGTPDSKNPSDSPWWQPLITPMILVISLTTTALPLAPAQAQTAASSIPNNELLTELQTRLLHTTRCQGPCVLASRADLKIEGDHFTMTVELHAQQESAWVLPGPAEVLQIQTILLDGAPTNQLRRDNDGMLLLRIPQGLHQVELRAQLPPQDVVTLQFHPEVRPKFITIKAAAWTVDGVNENGVPENSLQFTRQERPDEADHVATEAQSASNQGLAPWYEIHRQLGLGLPWQVVTTVSRLDSSRHQLLNVPLIPGEKVVNDGFEADQHRVVVSLERGISSVSYTSELPIQPSIELTAPTDQPWSEIWTVHCTGIWQCEYSDLPRVALHGFPAANIDSSPPHPHDQASSSLVAQPRWAPWPGQSLTIHINRPTAAQGRSSTVDHVSYNISPGQRLLQGQLTMTIRASQGGWQEVTLPPGAEVRSTTIDGESRNLRFEEGKLNLPLRPGKTRYHIEWQQPWEHRFIERAPAVDIGDEAVNIEVILNPSTKRWLLWTSGPSWGPAVLFWPYLITLILIAFLLSHLRGLPLRIHEWILLLIGFSQLPVLALVPLITWFIALRVRAARPSAGRWRFNITQLFLFGLTLFVAGTLYAAIHVNLLVDMDMQVSGANSSNYFLRWYLDRSPSALPTPVIYTLPLFIWRLLMLFWSLWLVSRLLKWIPWAWRSFSADGLWRRAPDKAGSDEAAPKLPEGEPLKPADIPPADGQL